MTAAATPLFARHYALFYEQLGRQLKAGLPAGATLANLLSGPVPAPMRSLIEDARRRVEAGEGIGETFGRHPTVIPRHEARFLAAAEAAGKLPAACERLAAVHKLRHERVVRFAGRLVYPVVMLLAAFMIAPFKLFFEERYLAYFMVAGLPVLSLLGAIAGAVWVAFSPAAGGARRGLYAFARRIPPLSAALRQLALAEVGGLLALCFEAGLPADQCVRLAGDATPDLALRKACHAVAAAVSKGSAIAPAMEAQGKAFPGVMVSVVRTGEEAGKLDESLAKAAEFWRDDADRAVTILVNLAVGAIMGLAMLVVVGLIIRTAMGWINQLGEIGGV